jgi:hypothetical protein
MEAPMVDRDEQERRYESAKREAKDKSETEARKRQATTDRLRETD